MPTQAPEPTRRAVLTQGRIREAARRELIDHGGQLELQRVARAAGVVPSVVSHHFGSRAGLVCALVDDFFDDLHANVLDLDLRDLGPWEDREHERIRLGVRFYFQDPMTPVVFGLLNREGDVAVIEAQRIAQIIEQSTRNIVAARRAGELPDGGDARLAAASIFGALRQVILTCLSRSHRPTQAAVVRQLWRVTCAAVDLPPTTGAHA